MNRLPEELSLLLGVEFAENYLKPQKPAKEIRDLACSGQTECIPHMKKIIRNLIKKIDINYLASVFQVSESFLQMISKQAKKAGHCLVCDIFSSNLKSHFKHFHDLTKAHFEAYKNSFRHQTEMFYPSLPQKAKLFSPYCSKTPELSKFRELLNIKNKPRLGITGNRSKSALVSDKTQESSGLTSSKHSLRKILSNLATKYREKIQVSSVPAKKGKNLEKTFESDVTGLGLDKKKGCFNSVNNFPGDSDLIEVSGDLKCREKLKNLGKITQKSKEKERSRVFSDDSAQCPLCSLILKKKGLKKHLRRHETRDNLKFK